VKYAECVHKAPLHQPVHPGPLLRQKSGYLLIGFGPGQVYLLVSGIQVAADHNPLSLAAEPVDVLQEEIIEVQLISQPLCGRLAVGKVDVVKQ